MKLVQYSLSFAFGSPLSLTVGFGEFLENFWSFQALLNKCRYRHAVTGAKLQIQPPETGGGILADEMGMGKSLSILALIMKTLEDAQSWADNKNSCLSSSASVTKRHSRATLVVASSACEFSPARRTF